MSNAVLVTGTSHGFGMEIALTLAARGFEVYASMRDLSRRAAIDEAAAARGLCLRVVQLDVTDQASVEAAVAQVVAETGGIYGVVNNAGLFLRGFFEDLTEGEIRRVFETNFYGTLAVTRAALPHMRRAGRGRVVIISSIAGKIGAPTGSAYSASRFAQEGFAEALWQELVPLGVYVALVEPGITKTESWAKADHSAAEGAANPKSPYYVWFQRAERLFQQAMSSSPNRVPNVAAAVARALISPRPPLRTMVGPRARVVAALKRLAPGTLFERLYFGAVIHRVTGVASARRARRPGGAKSELGR
jgi:NAD(P)-dependent dehydrogenase (short-subunit alcohol dehydrogenase family)